MMNLIVKRVDVWAASITDKLGGLAKILTGLRETGADLDFVIAWSRVCHPSTRRCGDRCSRYLGLQRIEEPPVGTGRGRQQTGSCRRTGGKARGSGDQPPWILCGCYRGKVHPVY
jgi:hypothetical protein